jgi:exopolysaccharide biosynthesis polyprenyl glycosylphosphotransferase
MTEKKEKQTSSNDDVMGSVFREDEGFAEGVLHRKRLWLSAVYPFALFFFDVFLIVVIFAVAVHWRYDVDFLQSMSRRILFVILAGSLSGVALIGGYKYKTQKSSFRFVSEHVIVSAVVFVGVFFLIFSVVAYGVKVNSARSVIAFTLVAFPICSIAYRFALSRLKLKFQQGNAICLIGAGEDAARLCLRIQQSKSTLQIIIVDNDPMKIGKAIEGCSSSDGEYIVQPLEDVSFNSSMNAKYVENYVVCCSFDDLPKPFLRKLTAAQFSGNKVSSYEGFMMDAMMMVPPSKITMDWVMNEGFRLNKNVTYDRIKRVADVFFSLFGIVCLSPVLLMAAIAVKLTSKGPVIFKQVRVGKCEKPFDIYKFRSMKVGSELGDKYTAKNDSRLTPIGKFLRKSRIDELPQFWNVLKGDLSIIGPRAEWIELVEGYEQKIPYYHFRHAIKPGITGWAQVNYSYGQNDEDTVEKFNYDLYYIRYYSPLLDMTIIIKTLYMVLFGRGQ